MDYAWLLLSFKGRINRARYLVVQLALLTVWFVLWLKSPFDFSSQWEAWVVAIAMLWIDTATTVKRLHDRNRSGWWAVAVFVVNRLSYVYYGLFFGLYFGVDISIARELLLVMFAVAFSLLQTWVVIELFFLIGTDGPNRFGPDPLSQVATGASTASRSVQHSVPAFLVHSAGLPLACDKRRTDRPSRCDQCPDRDDCPPSGGRRWIGPGTCSASRAASTAPNVARVAGHPLLDDLSGLLIVIVGSIFGGAKSFSFAIDDIFLILDPATYRSLSKADLIPFLAKLIGAPLFAWVYFATSIKRLHDRDKSGWWMIPFFVIPGLYNEFADRLGNSYAAMLLGLVAFVFLHLGLCRNVLPEGVAQDQPVRARPAAADRYQAALGAAERNRNGAAQGWPTAGLAC